MTSRDLDIVLLGATGFVGRFIAAHLIEAAPEGVRIGLAGRSRDKLDALAAGIGPAAERAELIEIDVRDWADLQALVARTKVIDSYKTLDVADIDLDTIGTLTVGDFFA